MDKWLSHPNSLKVISVLIAVLIWAVVHIDPQTSPQSVTSNVDTKVIEAVSIVPTGLDTDKYILTAMEPTVARLVVQGRITSLLMATEEDYSVQLDLSNAGPGIQELPLTVSLPEGIESLEVSPKTVTVHIEERATESFDVQIITEGKPAEGYVLGESKITSESGNKVEVTLPKDDFALVGMVAVTVNIDGADGTITNKKAKVVVYDTKGEVLPNAFVSPETVTVESVITLPSKEVPIQLRYTGNVPNNFSVGSITSELEKVKIYAQQSILDEITVYDGAIVDLSKVKQSGTINVQASAIDGIKSVEPAEIPVNVVIAETSTKNINNVPVNIIGLADGLQAEVEGSTNSRLNMSVQGASSLLQQFDMSDLTLTANLEGLSPGTHKITMLAELPTYLTASIEGKEGLEINVTIKAPSTETQTDNDAPLDPLEELEGSSSVREPITSDTITEEIQR